MKTLTAFLMLAFALCLSGQNPSVQVQNVNSVPAGACGGSRLAYVTPAGTLYTCQNGTWAQASGGGGAGTVSNCAVAGAIAYYSSTGTVVGCIAGLTVDGSGNLINTAGYQTGSGSSNSGFTIWSGASSGGSGFSAPAVAGTSILYLMPSTNGSAGQFLTDNGVATCPALPAGAPGLCHQLLWSAGASGALVQISKQTLGSGAATVTFSAIPGTYTSLRLVMSVRSDGTGTNSAMFVQFNGDATTTNYQTIYNFVDGGTATGGTSANSAFLHNIPAALSLANAFGTVETLVSNYAVSTMLKTGLTTGTGYGGGTTGSSVTALNLIETGYVWNSTAAITSLALSLSAGNFVTGSTFTLYGVQ